MGNPAAATNKFLVHDGMHNKIHNIRYTYRRSWNRLDWWLGRSGERDGPAGWVLGSGAAGNDAAAYQLWADD